MFCRGSWKPIIIFSAHLFTEDCVPSTIWQVCLMDSQNLMILSSQWIRAKIDLVTQGTLRQGTKPLCTINADTVRKTLHLFTLFSPNIVFWKISDIQKSWKNFIMNYPPTPTWVLLYLLYATSIHLSILSFSYQFILFLKWISK